MTLASAIGGTTETRRQLRDPPHCLCKDLELTGPLSMSCTSPREPCWRGCSNAWSRTQQLLSDVNAPREAGGVSVTWAFPRDSVSTWLLGGWKEAP